MAVPQFSQETVTGILSRAVATEPDRIFIDVGGRAYTYLEVEMLTRRVANGMAALGIKKGDRVGTLLDTSLDAVLIFFAASRIGAIYVPVNAAYKGEYLRHQYSDAGVEVVYVESHYFDRITQIAETLPKLRAVVRRGDDIPPEVPNVDVYRMADTLGSENPIENVNKFSDIAMLIYTGGTTGPSKGCIVSHNYVSNLARQTVLNGLWTKDDINWTPLPLFHMNSLGSSILAAAMVGARVALYPRFSVSNFWPEIERSGATICNLLGSMVPFIAEAPETEVSKRCYGQLRAVRGSPFPANMQGKWKERFGVKVAGSNVYGLTEACIVTSLPDTETPKPGSSGRRNAYFDVKIVDDDDQELPPGKAGEIIIRPKYPHIMMEGYWGRAEDTLKVMKNLWLHSGDLGMFDEDGFFYFVDRKKDYLRRRGENISSYELESTFRNHPAVEDVAVHAVYSETLEDEVKATIVLKTGAEPMTPEQMCAWSVDRLPYFAVPRYIEFRSDLPRNPVGRVLKYLLRDEGCTPATWDREAAGFLVERR
jgi:crotonobetaine/carnitine-CoA ligase